MCGLRKGRSQHTSSKQTSFHPVTGEWLGGKCVLINCILETSTAAFPAADSFCQTLRAPNALSLFKLQKLFISDGTRDEFHPLLKSFGLGRPFQASDRKHPQKQAPSKLHRDQMHSRCPEWRWVQREQRWSIAEWIRTGYGSEQLTSLSLGVLGLRQPILSLAICSKTHLSRCFSMLFYSTAMAHEWHVFLIFPQRVVNIIATSMLA